MGMEPIRLKKEVDVFVRNRLQYAIFFLSALQLFQDGIVELEDVDLRKETDCFCFLNTDFDRYDSTLQRALTDMNIPSDWTQETVENFVNYFRSKYAIDENGSGLNDKKL
ncbi:unnamed protein product, partial [Rotaria sp. Silwood1]